MAVLDTASRDGFWVEVREGERPSDVFRHPYAYATHHGIPTMAPSAAGQPDQALAA